MALHPVHNSPIYLFLGCASFPLRTKAGKRDWVAVSASWSIMLPIVCSLLLLPWGFSCSLPRKAEMEGPSPRRDFYWPWESMWQWLWVPQRQIRLLWCMDSGLTPVSQLWTAPVPLTNKILKSWMKVWAVQISWYCYTSQKETLENLASMFDSLPSQWWVLETSAHK